MAQDVSYFYSLKCIDLQYTFEEVIWNRKPVYILLKGLFDGDWQWKGDVIKIFIKIRKNIWMDFDHEPLSWYRKCPYRTIKVLKSEALVFKSAYMFNNNNNNKIPFAEFLLFTRYSWPL